jgi:hypothetical protein
VGDDRADSQGRLTIHLSRKHGLVHQRRRGIRRTDRHSLHSRGSNSLRRSRRAVPAFRPHHAASRLALSFRSTTKRCFLCEGMAGAADVITLTWRGHGKLGSSANIKRSEYYSSPHRRAPQCFVGAGGWSRRWRKARHQHTREKRAAGGRNAIDRRSRT